eukprot:SAG11_NODE_15669_length_570_cov_0.849257_1_plen_118_part_00
MEDYGLTLSEAQLQDIFDTAVNNNSGTVEFNELLVVLETFLTRHTCCYSVDVTRHSVDDTVQEINVRLNPALKVTNKLPLDIKIQISPMKGETLLHATILELEPGATLEIPHWVRGV